jgi:hypothetical protein
MWKSFLIDNKKGMNKKNEAHDEDEDVYDDYG